MSKKIYVDKITRGVPDIRNDLLSTPLNDYYTNRVMENIMMDNSFWKFREIKVSAWDHFKHPFVVIGQRLSHAWQALRYGECDYGGDY